MTIHFKKEIEKLKKLIMNVCASVEENFQKSVVAVRERNEQLAQSVVATDRLVDIREVEVEEECLKILALHQPVAADLRYVIAVMKLNNDLERIGDLAANLSEHAIELSRAKQAGVDYDFAEMAKKVKDMLQKSIESLVNMDAALAKEVLASDDEIDNMNRKVYEYIHKTAQEKPQEIAVLLRLLSVSRTLERIADYTTNIAEDVIYMIQGRIIRHQGKKQ